MEVRELQERIDAAFSTHFGRTALRVRLEDILKQSIELSRYTDLRHLREEAGDVLSAVLQLVTECGWDAEELVAATLAKIERRRDQYATLGRKTRVAILGGSFDPVTRGHLAAAQLILEASREFDEVWFMPAYQHMQKELSPPEHRLAMLRLATEGKPQLGVFDYEVRHQLRGETYHLMIKLLEEDLVRDRHEVAMAIGLDVANSLPTWAGSEDLLRLARFVVISRTGYEVRPNQWYLKPPHVYLHPDVPLDPLSSTLARKLAREGGDLEAVVPPAVAAYIREHGLYGARA